MTRTHRDIRRIKLRQLWDEIDEYCKQFGRRVWISQLPRHFRLRLRALETEHYYFVRPPKWYRKVWHGADRTACKQSLRSGSYHRYLRSQAHNHDYWD